MRETTEQQSSLPDGWEENIQHTRQRMKRQQQRVDQLMPACILGLFVCLLGAFILPNLLTIRSYRDGATGLCFALMFVAGAGLGFNCVRHVKLDQQIKKRFVFGGRSFGSGRNRVLLSDGPDRLHVRISGLMLFVLLSIALISGLFFAVAAAAFWETWLDPSAAMRGRRLNAPFWSVGIVFSVGGLVFLATGLLPLLLGWRFDFDRRRGIVSFHRLLQRQELPLAAIEKVETEQLSSASVRQYGGAPRTICHLSVDLILNDRQQSRLHVMRDHRHGSAAAVLDEFLFPDRPRPQLAEIAGTPVVLQPPVPSSSAAPGSLRNRRLILASMLSVVILGSASLGIFSWRMFHPLPPDVGELNRLIGAWEGSLSGPSEQSGTVTRESHRVAGSPFVRMIEYRAEGMDETQRAVKSLMFWRFDEASGRYRLWQFVSSGQSHVYDGVWNAGEQSFELTSLDDRGSRKLTVRCPSDGESVSELRDGNSEQTPEMHWAFRRVIGSAEPAMRWAQDNRPARLVPGMDWLMKRVGEWTRSERRTPSGTQRELHESTHWVLQGQYLESHRVCQAEACDEYAVAHCDADHDVLRYWNFACDGRVVELESEVAPRAYVPWEPADGDGAGFGGQWNFGTADAITERWQISPAGGQAKSVQVSLRRVGDSITPAIPPLLKELPPQRRRRTSNAPMAELVPPSGPNLLAAAQVSSRNGANPEAAIDDDPTTSWEAGAWLAAECEQPMLVRRLVIRHPLDRLYRFSLHYRDDATGQWRMHAGLRFNQGQITHSGGYKGFETVPNLIFVNGRPLSQFAQKHAPGSESHQLMEFQFVLPEAIQTKGVALSIFEAAAAPVLISEFKAYSD